MLKAAQEGNLQELQNYFRRRKPKFLIKDNHGWTALHFAAVWGHLEVVKFLLKQKAIDPEAETHEGETALFCALEHGASLDLITELLSVGKDIVNINNNEMFSPLMKACSLSLEYVMLLVDAGANINNQDFDNHTALHTAIRSDKFDIVEYLLHIGADAQITDIYGLTPLMTAVLIGCKLLVEMIIDFTVDINARAIDGTTALMLAPQHRDYDIIDTLLNNGADFMLMNDDDESALSKVIHTANIPNVQRILSVMTDEQIANLLDISYGAYIHLFWSIYHSSTFDSESIKVVNRLIESTSPKTLAKYDGLLMYFTHNFFFRIIEKHRSHVEYILQILLKKGVSFDGVLDSLKDIMFTPAITKKSIIKVFDLYIKYGFNFYYPPSGFKVLDFSDKKCFYLQQSEFFNLSCTTESKCRETDVNSLKELSRRTIAKKIAKSCKSTQRYILKIRKLPLPESLISYMLELKQ